MALSESGPADENFFKNLDPIENFSDSMNYNLHKEIPQGWYVVVADILGSTTAIENGQYRQVNSIGASTIMALINVNRDIEIPYVFGGDGATAAIPPSMEFKARQALLGSKNLAWDGFSLDLRVGLVPASYLTQRNFNLKIGKQKVSEHITQAALSGTGWAQAEELIKDPKTRDQFEVRESEQIKPDADFTGFECRWQGIDSRNDHKISLIAAATTKDPSDQLEFYQQLLAKVKEIYGADDQHHPDSQTELKLALNPTKLQIEAKIRAPKNLMSQIKYRFISFLQNLAGLWIFAKNLDTKSVKWSRYRQDLIMNADYKKFDGMLKMILDGTNDQEEKIRKFLDSAYQDRAAVYGISTSKQALITCLVFSYNGEHAHFVDGADGGYTMAAKRLKERMKRNIDPATPPPIDTAS